MLFQKFSNFQYDLIYLFAITPILYYCIKADTHIEIENHIVKSISCEIQQTLKSKDSQLFLNCTVNITYEYYEDFSNFSCKHYKPNSLLVTVAQHNVINNSIVCFSSSPIFVKTDSENLDEDVLQMQWHRTFPDFNDPASYIYELHINPPTQNEIHVNKAVVAVRYKLFNSHDTENQIHILWFFDDLSSLAFLGDKLVDNTIIVTKEMVNIPCVYRNPGKAMLFRKSPQGNDKMKGAVTISVDNKSVSYDPIHGFIINTTQFANYEGQFGCLKTEPYEKSKYFTIVKPDFTSSSQFHHDSLNPPSYESPFVYNGCETEGFTYVADFHQSQCDLKCSATNNSNVTFSIRNEDKLMRQMKDVVYSLNYKPIKTHSAMITTPKINRTMEIQCQSVSNGTIFHEWKFFQALSTVTSDNQKNTLKCSAYNMLDENVIFTQMGCNDKFSCREMAPALFKLNSSATKIYIGSDCSMSTNDNEKCKSLNALTKGYFQCTTTKGNNNTATEIDRCLSKRVYQDIYFVGFDNKLYVGNAEPPNSAILKVELVGNSTDRNFVLPGNFEFFCEAHSFYFEHGIEWFVVYRNNTRVLLPPGNVTEIIQNDLPKDNFPNVRRFSRIHLEDSSVQKIMCAAPLMSILNHKNRFKWKYASMNVSLKYFTLPKIKNVDSMKYFRVGATNQSLLCQATGFPTPEITWTYKTKKIKEPLTTTRDVNGTILNFPVYKENMAGKYICTARNKMGVTNETFSVQTAYVEIQSLQLTNVNSMFAIVLSLCVLAIVLPVLIIYCWVRSHRKKQLNEDIRKFVEGNVCQSENNENSALLVPYNEQYEILRSQFEIDMKAIIGKGSFGIVYKGKVSTVNYCGSVAFKTLKPGGRQEKFKSLLAELKLMIYAGHHENIIRLVAAYTKELHNGIVYIATELCSLGSLEQYLRKNNNEIVRLRRTGSSNSDRCSVKSPLKIFSREKLCCWSSQIANGMEYLESKHIVHSDLATRNILLNSEEIAKITDFDLSRHMYNYINYVKKDGAKDPLPWKWMALESLYSMTFSTQSDVWAYGITLWEIFSLGAVPYPGISWTIDFVEMLENGLRNPKPKLADSKIYKVMSTCWSKYPLERPSFNCLKTFFMKLASNQKHLEVPDLFDCESDILEDNEGYLIPSLPDITKVDGNTI